MTQFTRRQRASRPLALWLSASLIVPPLLAGCGSNTPPPPVDDTQGGMRPAPPRMQPPAKTGMSMRKKLVILAGAAALYYLYKKHQNAKSSEPQYYLSKNGRVYYRDAEHRAHYVTPPPGGIQVPESEAAQYRDFQGYDNRRDGRDLTGLPEAVSP